MHSVSTVLGNDGVTKIYNIGALQFSLSCKRLRKHTNNFISWQIVINSITKSGSRKVLQKKMIDLVLDILFVFW